MDAATFAEAWYAAWNARDLDAILAHYADDVEFTSQVAARRGIPRGTLRGKAALRAYFAEGLAATPDLRFEPVELLLGPTGVTLYYRGVGGIHVAETMLLDENGLATRCIVHYAKREGASPARRLQESNVGTGASGAGPASRTTPPT